MLPLIALAQETPLVIDQPEDNLDKRLIGTVLKNVLAVLKEKRQIIVCTHDPNILVGGDAEQVVVMEAESDRRGRDPTGLTPGACEASLRSASSRCRSTGTRP